MAVEVADLASDTPPFHVEGFIENLQRPVGTAALDGLPVFWVDDIASMVETHLAVCALATTRRSRFTAQVSKLGLRFATLVHPSARISRSSALGKGTIVSVGVIVASHTSIGSHVFVNRGALIGHHTIIGDHVSVMPGANIAGNCIIGEETYVGMGALVLDNINVGSRSVVGAGAVVTKDVPDNVQVIGNPARIVKRNIEGK